MSLYDLAPTPEGDLDAADGGRLATGPEAIAAVLRIRYQTFLGEYFMDSRRGIPWAQWVERKASEALLAEVRAVFAAETLAVPGVLGLVPPGVRVSFSTTTRTLTIGLTARIRDGVLPVTVSVPPHAGAVITIIMGASGAIVP